MRESNPALLTRMTALHLRCMFEEERAEALAAMVGDMPALQSLDVGANALWTDGLVSLAGVVPGLTALTLLDVSDCAVSGPGVLAMLEALLRPGAAGPERLRHLIIAGNCERPWEEHAVGLATHLRRFRGLTALDMLNIELGRAGLQAVVEALETLPDLRHLDARGNGVGDVQSLFTHGMPMPDMPDGEPRTDELMD